MQDDNRWIVLTAVGRDRVGIVAELSDVLYGLGCNLLDSSMTLLRGEFAIILMVQLPAGRTVDEMSSRLSSLEEKLGLSVSVRELSAEEIKEPGPSGNPYMISVYGADKPGIVAGVTRKLADLGVNITDVETKFTNEGRDSLFVMILEVTVPSVLPMRAIESVLAEASKELGVDISVQSVEVYEL